MKNWEWRMGFIALFIGLLIPFPRVACAEIRMPTYKEMALTPENLDAMQERVTNEFALWVSNYTSQKPGNAAKVAGHPHNVAYLHLLGDLQSLEDSLPKGSPGPEATRAFLLAQRVHYSLLADEAKDAGVPVPGFKSRTTKLFRMLRAPDLLEVKCPKDPKDPIGEAAAAHEALDLVDPATGETLDPARLAQLSHLDVSRLNPFTGHTAFREGPIGYSRFDEFLGEMTALVRLTGGRNTGFDFLRARRILFLDSIPSLATAPKAKCRDRFGNGWFVKWGRQCHSDPAVTRLYIAMGGTYVDQKFYSGPGETLVVLAPPNDPDPEAVKDFPHFVRAMKNSKYKWDPTPYLEAPTPILDSDGTIQGSGIVTAEQAEREDIDLKYVGALFLTFKECQLSFMNPAIKRLGGSAMSTLGATEDRFTRGLLIFNALISNGDVKDDNSCAGFLLDPESGRYDRLVEFQSDLDSSFMGYKALMKWGVPTEWISYQPHFLETHTNLWGSKALHFKYRPFYVPEAFVTCTFADARWMALRLARLTRSDIEACFAESGWPVIIQQLLTERLISRRNELVAPLRLELDGIEAIPCTPEPTITIHTKQGPEEAIRKGKLRKTPTVKDLCEMHPEGLFDEF